jgi:transcriptional regulator with XRE-family HTH domain
MAGAEPSLSGSPFRATETFPDKNRLSLSQDALAADANQHQGLISEIENGRANPELDTLGKIAAALGVHPGELLEE